MLALTIVDLADRKPRDTLIEFTAGKPEPIPDLERCVWPPAVAPTPIVDFRFIEASQRSAHLRGVSHGGAESLYGSLHCGEGDRCQAKLERAWEELSNKRSAPSHGTGVRHGGIGLRRLPNRKAREV